MKKVATNEDDAVLLMERYSPSTIITLLQEIDQIASVKKKIDWNALVKKTATGITNAREYQMLWRHMAYRHPLSDKIEEGAEPLDDESDLEIELEIVPPIIEEASNLAEECVKRLREAGRNQSTAGGSERGKKVERSELEPENKEAAEEGEQRLAGRKRPLDD